MYQSCKIIKFSTIRDNNYGAAVAIFDVDATPSSRRIWSTPPSGGGEYGLPPYRGGEFGLPPYRGGEFDLPPSGCTLSVPMSPIEVFCLTRFDIYSYHPVLGT